MRLVLAPECDKLRLHVRNEKYIVSSYTAAPEIVLFLELCPALKQSAVLVKNIKFTQ